MLYIREMKDNDRVVGHFFCKQKLSLKSNQGKTYYSLKLQDKTGTIDGKVWDLSNDIGEFSEGEFVKIDGTVLVYQNDLQIKVKKLRQSAEGEYDPGDFIPQTEKNIDELYAKIVGFIDSLKNPMLKRLMENMLVNNAKNVAALKTHTAAKSLHHSYMGGLLEHTVSVAETCEFLSSRYKYVNRDLLLSTAMLHDIGKIEELSKMPVNDYTDDGKMLGHIVIGAEMVARECSKIPGFDGVLESLVKHSIIAHHGEFEYGSPKLPNTIEAFLLHCADNLDAKTKAFEECIDNEKSPGPWTGFHKTLNRYVRNSELN